MKPKTKQEVAECLQEHKSRKLKSRISLPAPVKAATSFVKGAQIVIPKHVKVEQCPGYRGDRFAHTEPVEGGFRTLGPGRYLPDEDAALRRLARKAA